MPELKEQVRISPNSLNLYLECPCCFWLEKRMRIKRPQPYPYSLNLALDFLFKKEFDECRKKGGKHPLLEAGRIRAKLFQNQKLLNQWRSKFGGIRYYDKDLRATLFGALDDVLEFEDGRLAPLDYKSAGDKMANLYDRFQIQMDVYTYLLEKNGFSTPRKGYLAFCFLNKKSGFGDKLLFRKEIQEIETDPSDIYQLFKEAVGVLKREIPSPHSRECRYGQWFKKALKLYHS